MDDVLVDNVNHPQHYMSNRGIETIDVIEAFTEDCDGFEAYLIGNITKYISRWKKKNGVEDLKKAQWYLNRLIKYKTIVTTSSTSHVSYQIAGVGEMNEQERRIECLKN